MWQVRERENLMKLVREKVAKSQGMDNSERVIRVLDYACRNE